MFDGHRPLVVTMTIRAARPISSDSRPVARSGMAVLVLVCACNGTTKPIGQGDDLIVDVEASLAPPSPMQDAPYSEDSPFGQVDAPYGSYSSGTSAMLAVCAQCACASGTYCFGGGTGATPFSGSCGPVAGRSGLEIGCQAMPGACANEPDCPCILAAIDPLLSCIAVCVETPAGGFTAYCPTP
jgi:hypothetical protein